MPKLKRTAAGLAVAGLLLGAGLPTTKASAQEVVHFGCSSSQTISHEMSPASGSARFTSNSCICGSSPKIAKALLIQILSTPAEYRSDALAKALKFSHDLMVEEGTTATATIYCYSAETVNGLLGAMKPPSGNAPSGDPTQDGFDDF